jgi:hypothetical protein
MCSGYRQRHKINQQERQVFVSQIQSYVTTDGQAASFVLVSDTHLGPIAIFVLLSDSCGPVDVGHQL